MDVEMNRRIVTLRQRVPILAIAFELAVMRMTEKMWVTDCPVCGNVGQFVLVAPDTFQCGACRITGDVHTMIRIFRKMGDEEALLYMEHWATANPSGVLRAM